MNRIFSEILVLSSHQFTDKPSCDWERKLFSRFRHLRLVLTALVICLPISLFGQTSGELNEKATIVRVPFVGCRSDGQVGPRPAPKGANKIVRLDAVKSKRLAYYKSETPGGVLAPRDWHGFGTYGSSGSSLIVSPHPIKWEYVFSAIGRLVAKIFADCYFPLASGKMTRY
jgi:hypothetical protein